jgi:hypothetical protein
VRLLGFSGNSEQAEHLILGLSRALPHLEILALGLEFQMGGATLQELSRHCPRLTVLDLPRTQLCLSLALMVEAHPLSQLQVMHFARIYFESPRHLMKSRNFQSVVAQWRRVFPKLRAMPCTGDIYSRYVEEDCLEEPEGDRAGVCADEETAFSKPGIDFDDYESDWFILHHNAK